MPTPLATFTPSLVGPETLERLFVAREAVLDDLIERARSAATSDARRHRLLVGPRGAGKTHLTALARHRIASLEPAPMIAWLPEDPWTIDGYADLLREMLLAARRHLGIDERRLRREPVESLEQALRDFAGQHGPIVVLSENFDLVLEALGTQGQRQLRGFMENERLLLLLVTATRLTNGILRQDGPFYGFFSTHELAPLTLEQATDLLIRVAEHRGDEALAARLRAPTATDRYRLSAIDALAGGQPRVWTLLASALTVDGLDSLAEILLTRFDDLTPYYQEQLGKLSPQERKVVRELADLDRAVNVTDLADELGIERRSVAKTVSTLRRNGWLVEVRPPLGVGDKRRTYFELAEPLARLAFQLKDNRGEAVPLLVAFLSTWFSREELTIPAEKLSPFGRVHLDAAIVAGDIHRVADAFGTGRRSMLPDPLLHALSDALEALHTGDPEPYFALPSTARRVIDSAIEDRGLEDTRRLCIQLSSGGPEWIGAAERLFSTGTAQIKNGLAVLILYHRAERYSAAVAFAESLLEALAETDRRSRGQATSNRVVSLGIRSIRLVSTSASTTSTASSKVREAHAKVVQEATEILGSDHPLTLSIRLNSLSIAERHEPETAIESHREFVADLERILGPEHSETLSARIDMASHLLTIGNHSDALALLREFTPSLTNKLGRSHLFALKARSIASFATVSSGDIARALVMLTDLLEDQHRILGPKHPDSLKTARVLEELSRTAETPSSNRAIPLPPAENRLVAEPPAPPYGSGTSHSQ